MSRLEDVQRFIDAAAGLASLADLRSLMAAAIGDLGFDHFGMAQHISFAAPGPAAIQIGNYPIEWLAQVRERRYYADDPVFVACQGTSAGFLWRDLPRLVHLTERQKRILTAAARSGVGDGFTVPNHVPGEALGSCSFAVSTGRALPLRSIPAAQSIGTFGFEAARRILRAGRGDASATYRRAPLTQRQLDCIVLIAKGKSDTVAAQLLGLSPRTVNEHVEAARRRFAVATRTQLIVRALFESHITYADVIQ